MKKFRVRFILDNGNPVYHLEARDSWQAWEMGCRLAKEQYGPPREGEDVFVDEWVDGKWSCNVELVKGEK